MLQYAVNQSFPKYWACQLVRKSLFIRIVEITHLSRVQNSHRLAPVFAVLSVLGFIDDGRLHDFDRVPYASWDDAAVIAGGRVQDNACRFMEATPNCHILLLFNAISRSLFPVKHRTRLPD